jgi:hypothetical protein
MPDDVKDKALRDEIKAIITEAQEEDHHGNLLMYSDEAADLILSLIAPELEKARKYDEAYSRWPSVVDHERWWNETKAVLEQRPAKEPT